MPFNIIRNSIASVTADAIVYADTPQPFTLFSFNPLQFGKGKELIKTRQKLGSISNGDAKIIPASELDAKYIIHTSAPVWHNGLYHEKRLLRSCYEKSFKLALEQNCESIALPIIATDNLGYPKKMTEQIAFECIRDFLSTHDVMISIVLPEKAVLQSTIKPYSDVRKYIESHYVEDPQQKEETGISNTLPDVTIQAFSDTLSQWMSKKNINVQDICHKANMSTRVLSEILTGKAHELNKNHVIALGIALELSLEEMKQFLTTAGYELDYSNESDIITEYHILQNKYDIVTINQILFRFGQPLLGC